MNKNVKKEIDILLGWGGVVVQIVKILNDFYAAW